MLSHVQLFVTPWNVKPTRPLCLWNFPGKKTGVGCHFYIHALVCMSVCLVQGNPGSVISARQQPHHLLEPKVHSQAGVKIIKG